MASEIIDISFEYPDKYTKKIRLYTGKAKMQDSKKGVYIAYELHDENKKPPVHFSNILYLQKTGTSGKNDVARWISSNNQDKDELITIIGEAIEFAEL